MIVGRYCGIFEARSLEDALGATCGRQPVSDTPIRNLTMFITY
jgi:hypothetical protein